MYQALFQTHNSLPSRRCYFSKEKEQGTGRLTGYYFIQGDREQTSCKGDFLEIERNDWESNHVSVRKMSKERQKLAQNALGVYEKVQGSLDGHTEWRECGGHEGVSVSSYDCLPLVPTGSSNRSAEEEGWFYPTKVSVGSLWLLWGLENRLAQREKKKAVSNLERITAIDRVKTDGVTSRVVAWIYFEYRTYRFWRWVGCGIREQRLGIESKILYLSICMEDVRWIWIILEIRVIPWMSLVTKKLMIKEL